MAAVQKYVCKYSLHYFIVLQNLVTPCVKNRYHTDIFLPFVVLKNRKKSENQFISILVFQDFRLTLLCFLFECKWTPVLVICLMEYGYLPISCADYLLFPGNPNRPHAPNSQFIRHTKITHT